MAPTPRTFEGLHSTIVIAGDAMHVYTDGASFDEALRAATHR